MPLNLVNKLQRLIDRWGQAGGGRGWQGVDYPMGIVHSIVAPADKFSIPSFS